MVDLSHPRLPTTHQSCEQTTHRPGTASRWLWPSARPDAHQPCAEPPVSVLLPADAVPLPWQRARPPPEPLSRSELFRCGVPRPLVFHEDTAVGIFLRHAACAVWFPRCAGSKPPWIHSLAGFCCEMQDHEDVCRIRDKCAPDATQPCEHSRMDGHSCGIAQLAVVPHCCVPETCHNRTGTKPRWRLSGRFSQ